MHSYVLAKMSTQLLYVVRGYVCDFVHRHKTLFIYDLVESTQWGAGLLVTKYFTLVKLLFEVRSFRYVTIPNLTVPPLALVPLSKMLYIRQGRIRLQYFRVFFHFLFCFTYPVYTSFVSPCCSKPFTFCPSAGGSALFMGRLARVCVCVRVCVSACVCAYMRMRVCVLQPL